MLEYHQHWKYTNWNQFFCIFFIFFAIDWCLHCNASLLKFEKSCTVRNFNCFAFLRLFYTSLFCDFTFLICCVENSFDKRYQPVLMKGWWKISHTAWQSLVRRYGEGYCTIWSALPETLCKSFPQMNWITSSSDTWDQVSSLWLRNCDWLRRNSQRSGGQTKQFVF